MKIYKDINKTISNWCFVTGAIRSGTTFVGKILSLPFEVDYIHEPFNPQCGIPGVSSSYRYIRSNPSEAHCHPYHPFAESIFNYSLKLQSHIPASDPLTTKLMKSVVGSRGPFNLRMAKLNPLHKAAIIKDPMALLMTDYLYVNFQVKPIILVKHPISFIASLKRVNWWPSPSEIFDQPELIDDFFSEELEFVRYQWPSLISQSSAYWRSVYKVLLSQKEKYEDWHIITHEQLSLYPVDTFRTLYQSLNLPWSERIEKTIITLTKGQKSPQARNGKVQDFKRKSADIFQYSIHQLTMEERRKVFDITADISCKIYSIESFEI